MSEANCVIVEPTLANCVSKKKVASEIKLIQATSRAIPELPLHAIPIDEIKNLPPFSGVYIAYVGDDVVYVGEGQNVSDRCRKSRPELSDCTHVSVIRCAGYERLRIESYFIGLLDPPRNELSTNGSLKGRARNVADPVVYKATPPKKELLHELWREKHGLFQVNDTGNLLLPNIHKLNECHFSFDPNTTWDEVEVVRLLPGTHFEKKGNYWREPSESLKEFTDTRTHHWIRLLQDLACQIHVANVTPSYEESAIGTTTWIAPADGGTASLDAPAVSVISPAEIKKQEAELEWKRLELAEIEQELEPEGGAI